ncbi:Mitochondrial inner membrane translocase complex, subunit Tim44-related protein [Arabidopsis thaliana]|uniref:Large ribosomal subunit protein mL45 n=1 Tax=Arabidopsis thaliana TaxID=3702 RepID=B3H4A1_ARATH|nr:Mitochondrial inner membrane translocase complex, subunit Tim44-related protein [Arabidopsis thaliana]AED93680.1 Mitochondrial inner membrane translocase complex, subunit Tim44-related protein [Arabidopsis thaliana]|eukprot:NP_001119286.1 Mitochondrial inner membrane translocase complex, subunit Tim44-related protein [Arabidopsis thaliana]
MSLVRRFQTVRSLLKTAGSRESSSLPFGCWRSYHSSLCHVPEAHGKSAYSRLYEGHSVNTHLLRSTMIAEFLPFMNEKRSATTQVKAPPQLQKTGAVRVSMVSPGFVYEPYALREKISIWRRCFTRSGWRRTKEDFIRELRSAYAIAKLRKTGYSKNTFYIEALELYKQINIQMANGEKKTIRKNVTERMYSALKNEIKQREAMWDGVYWEMVEPVVKIRTLQARLIGIDRTDLKKAFIQLTLEFLTKQKFEAYDAKGNVAAGDKNKEVLVRDIWVFEKSLFHTGAYWRLCGRIKL